MEDSRPSPQITASDDFPVVWESEEDRLAYWVRDNEHVSGPNSPLEVSLGRMSERGTAQAAEKFGMPLGRPETRLFNGYNYRRVVGDRVRDEAIVEQARRSQKKIDRASRTLVQRWQNRFIPELLRDHEFMLGFDLRAASRRQLMAHLRRVLKIQERHWFIHFYAAFPMDSSFEKLVEVYAECTGQHDEMAAYKLVQGFDNKTIEANRILWQLSREAKSDSALARIFGSVPDSKLRGELEKDEHGRAFMEKVQAFLDVHGYKSTNLEDLADPTWREDPAFVLGVIKSYVEREGYDFEAELRGLVEERETLVAEIRGKLAGSPAKRRRFDAALKLAQETWPLREDHAFYIDNKSSALLRYIFLEFGRRFVEAGTLERAEDVFMLKFEDILEAARKPGGIDLRPVAAARRNEWETWLRLRPPRFLGTPPPRPPSRAPSQVVSAAADGRTMLRGSPGSAGIVKGVARIVRSPADFGKLKPGEIMVCETTKPPWTPVFATIGGLIVDTGGALSHGAVVAREYRIPAVMGTRQGSRAIRDGQIVEVDGGKGLVYLDGDS